MKLRRLPLSVFVSTGFHGIVLAIIAYGAVGAIEPRRPLIRSGLSSCEIRWSLPAMETTPEPEPERPVETPVTKAVEAPEVVKPEVVKNVPPAPERERGPEPCDMISAREAQVVADAVSDLHKQAVDALSAAMAELARQTGDWARSAAVAALERETQSVSLPTPDIAQAQPEPEQLSKPVSTQAMPVRDASKEPAREAAPASDALAQGAQQVDPTPKPANREPTYPSKARRLGYQGSVTVKLEVLASGRVGRVEVVTSSGYGVLDRAAVKAIEEWQFAPATRGGETVSVWLTETVHFRLR